MKRCMDCRFFSPGQYQGECRRNPPVLYVITHHAGPHNIASDTTMTGWPNVMNISWCGEFKPLTREQSVELAERVLQNDT